MTGEEMERAIEFLLQSQANSEARLGRLEGIVERLAGTHERLGESHERLGESHERLTESHERLAAAQGRSQEQIDQLQQGFVRFQNGMDELRQQVGHIAKVAEIALETSLRASDGVDALVKLVGGLIEGRGGGVGRDG